MPEVLEIVGLAQRHACRQGAQDRVGSRHMEEEVGDREAGQIWARPLKSKPVPLGKRSEIGRSSLAAITAGSKLWT